MNQGRITPWSPHGTVVVVAVVLLWAYSSCMYLIHPLAARIQ